MTTIKYVVLMFFIVASAIMFLGNISASPAEPTALQDLIKRVERDVSYDINATDEKGHRIYCINSTPCRWEIYQRHTRLKDYVVTNTCKCEPTKICARDEDDVSLHAYVNRCKLISSFTAEELEIIRSAANS